MSWDGLVYGKESELGCRNKWKSMHINAKIVKPYTLYVCENPYNIVSALGTVFIALLSICHLK